MNGLLPAELAERIAKIPPTGEWWHSSSQDGFVIIAMSLMDRGFSDDDIMDVLERAYGSVANEFGA